MTSEARAALREKVFAITKVCAEPCEPDANDCPCRVDADAAIALALNRAIQICDEYGVDPDCTAAIRGLKGDVFHNPPNETG
jgi:hypothetical protein